MDMIEMIHVTENHLTALRNFKTQAENMGDLEAVLHIEKSVISTDLTLANLRKKTPVQAG